MSGGDDFDILSPRGDRYVYVKNFPIDTSGGMAVVMKDGFTLHPKWAERPERRGWHLVKGVEHPVELYREGDADDWFMFTPGACWGKLNGREVCEIPFPPDENGEITAVVNEVVWNCSKSMPPGRLLVAQHDGAMWIATRSLTRFDRMEVYADRKPDWTDPPACGMYDHREQGRAVLIEFSCRAYGDFVKACNYLNGMLEVAEVTRGDSDEE